MAALTQHDWPGNVRELENAIERAVVLAESEVLRPPDLLYYGLAALDAAAPTATGANKTLAEVEKEHITQTLARCRGNKTRAASCLGIDRKTLRLKLKRFGLS